MYQTQQRYSMGHESMVQRPIEFAWCVYVASLHYTPGVAMSKWQFRMSFQVMVCAPLHPRVVYTNPDTLLT